MKHSVRLILLLIIMVLFSCSNEPLIESEMLDQSVVSKSEASKSAVNKSSVPVWERPDGPPDGDYIEIKGAYSTLHRNKNGITVNFKTNGLIPNNAYTVWWVVFGDAPGPPNVTYATGHIAGGSGMATFSAHKSVGSDFNNPLSAEVHVAIRSHGAVQPGMTSEQIQTELGGCDPSLTLPQGPGGIWPDSDVVGYCANVQVAMHPKN